MEKGSYRALFARTCLGTFACALVLSPQLARAAEQGSGSQAAVNVGEIVVTAQRREERLVDVPVSITALGAERLQAAGVTNAQALAQVTPGLIIGQTGVLTQPVIRGIGSTGTNVGDSSNVATYIDGVYQATQYGGLFEFNDVKRIDVLKGPQGTLFGRNATGGAIQVFTEDPSPETQVRGSLRYGSYNDRAGKIFATGGTDMVAASLAAVYQKDDGYIRDIYQNNKVGVSETKGLRGKVLVRPDPNTKITLGYSNMLIRSDFVVEPYFLLNNSRSEFLFPALPLANTPRRTALTVTPYVRVNTNTLSATLEHDFDGFRVKSVTAHQYIEMENLTDLDGGPAPIQQVEYQVRDKVDQEELTLASTGTHRVDWVGGLFLFRDDATQPYFIINGAPFIEAGVLTKAYGVFGELNFHVNDRLSVIGGLRYSWEEKQLKQQGLLPPTAVFRTSQAWNSLTPRVSVRYGLAPNTNIYASYTKGFKSGAYNSSALPPSSLIPVSPEKVTAYEVGFKTFRGPFYLSAAVYHYDDRDIQVSAFVASSTAITQLQNAATAKITGVDGDLVWQATDQLKFDAGASYAHARYDKFPGAILLAPAPNGNGNVQSRVDASGNHMIRQPTVTFNVGLSYTVPVSFGRVQFTTNTQYTGKFYWDTANTLAQKAYSTTNARLALFTQDDRYSIAVFGNNIFGAEYNILASLTSTGTRGVAAKPATGGVEISAKF